jgi:hypothetical protein
MVSHKGKFEDFDRIAGALQGDIIEMLEWLRTHGYTAELFLKIIRRWRRWAADNSLVFNEDFIL